MCTKIEIAKRNSRIETNEIEALIKDLASSNELKENSIVKIPSKSFKGFGQFAADLHSITTNKIIKVRLNMFTWKTK